MSCLYCGLAPLSTFIQSPTLSSTAVPQATLQCFQRTASARVSRQKASPMRSFRQCSQSHPPSLYQSMFSKTYGFNAIFGLATCRYRPIARMGSMMFESPQTALFTNVLKGWSLEGTYLLPVTLTSPLAPPTTMLRLYSVDVTEGEGACRRFCSLVSSHTVLILASNPFSFRR